MRLPRTPKSVIGGTPIQFAATDHARVSSISVSPISKKTAFINGHRVAVALLPDKEFNETRTSAVYPLEGRLPVWRPGCTRDLYHPRRWNRRGSFHRCARMGELCDARPAGQINPVKRDV